MDIRYVESAARGIAEELHGDHEVVIINKSMVPVGSGDLVTRIIRQNLRNSHARFVVVSNPDFLREGSAVQDFQNPDRIVLGSPNQEAAHKVASLYLPLRTPIIITDIYTAEMIKYASNAFFATKVSFINEIARICERLGANVKEVAMAMGYDKRIGQAFLDAGLGYEGSCLYKEVHVLATMAKDTGLHPKLLDAVTKIHHSQCRLIVDRLSSILGSLRDCTIGILGLAVKPNTDDVLEAPALDIISWVIDQGATVRAYDPVAVDAGRRALEGRSVRMDAITFCQNAYEVAEGADALVMMTEWDEFKLLNMLQIRTRMRRLVLIDGLNIYETAHMNDIGFIYCSTEYATELISSSQSLKDRMSITASR